MATTRRYGYWYPVKIEGVDSGGSGINLLKRVKDVNLKRSSKMVQDKQDPKETTKKTTADKGVPTREEVDMIRYAKDKRVKLAAEVFVGGVVAIAAAGAVYGGYKLATRNRPHA